MRRLVLALMLGLLGGCAQSPNLEPAPEADQVTRLIDAAEVEAAGVRVLVQADAWPGYERIVTEVTPLRVRIVNDSGQPLRLRYQDFALVGDAQVYPALPPRRIGGSVSEPRLADDAPPIVNPGFAYSGFQVAPFYGPVYPGIEPFGAAFAVDPLYYDRQFGYWERTELPTPEMLARVLPEGVLAPGGRVEGFLYFEKVDPGVTSRLRYRAALVNARTGERFATVSVPFLVNPRG